MSPRNAQFIISIRRTSLFILVSLLLFSCNENSPTHDKLKYTTTSDSALYYYNLGWKQIMDDGFYGPAEISYRKALEFDSNFLIGKATLARLTLDLEERLQLYKEVQNGKSNTAGDERLILDIYQGLVHFTNVREQSPSGVKAVIDSVLIIAENNLRYIVHKYPEEIYLKSEYVEILNSNYGAKTALDSLDVLCTAAQKENPFLLGFAASLNATEGDFENALSKAHRLSEIINGNSIPKVDAVYADIYLKMDNLGLAKIHADQAVILDSRNLDASRLKTKIDKAIKIKAN